MNKNNLLLDALQGKPVKRPPVWLMRQAGRYLSEYRKLAKKYDFFTRIKTPELACEITLQPIDRFQPDAAILFSDILTVPEAMGLEVQMVQGKGPYLPQTIENQRDIERLEVATASDRLDYVYQAIRTTQNSLAQKTPLIGFAGAPFTLLCYMVDGQGTKTFLKTRKFCFSEPTLAHQVLEKITAVTKAYLQKQIDAGVHAVQLFDSWSGLLAKREFNEFCLPYIRQIAEHLDGQIPIIYFPKGNATALAQINTLPIQGVGLDWCTNIALARQETNKCLQGNFDPAKLFLPQEALVREVRKMIQEFGVQNYIANLGHGISPEVPVESVSCFIDTVKSWS